MALRCSFHADGNAVAQAAAELIASRICSAITSTGECMVAVAGGSTPGPTYRRLRTLDIDWGKVYLVQTDERMTAVVGDRSAAAIESSLGLSHEAGESSVGGWYPILGITREDAVRDYSEQLSSLRPDGVPDIAVLGLGTDGHTASIFSHDLQGSDGERVVATAYHGAGRVSLGLGYLRAIPTRILIATGASKKAALTSIVTPIPGQPPLPAAAVLGDDGYVFADQAARPQERGCD